MGQCGKMNSYIHILPCLVFTFAEESCNHFTYCGYGVEIRGTSEVGQIDINMPKVLSLSS